MSTVEVLVLGGGPSEEARQQRTLVVEVVLPRFREWCSRLGMSVRPRNGSRAERPDEPGSPAARHGPIELRLPIRARSPRLVLADQIFSDLCAIVAARHPERLAAVMACRTRTPEPVTQPVPAAVPAPPPPPQQPSTLPTMIMRRPTAGCSVARAGGRGGRDVAGPGPSPKGALFAFTFHIVTGGKTVDVRTVASRSITLGRMATCDVTILDCSVSRKHALVEIRGPDRVFLTDLGSANGVWVNGQQIGSATRLRSGDEIRLGAVVIGVHFPTPCP